jgi:hypothetical protein
MTTEAEKAPVWPWVLGGLTVAGVVTAGIVFLWPSEAEAKEPPKPLTKDERKQIRSLACLCWRGGAKTAPKLAICISERLRPQHKWPPKSAASTNAKAIWATVQGDTAEFMYGAAQAKQDLCDWIEGKKKKAVPAEAIVRVPNVSKDKAGYNTKIFADFRGFRNLLKQIGYQPGDYSVDKKPEGTSVKRFQEDWNRVAAAVKAGRIGAPWAYRPKGFHYTSTEPTPIKGGDNVPGGQTANALEIAVANQFAGRAWKQLVSEAKG